MKLFHLSLSLLQHKAIFTIRNTYLVGRCGTGGVWPPGGCIRGWYPYYCMVDHVCTVGHISKFMVDVV